jgi:hypothetical protein
MQRMRDECQPLGMRLGDAILSTQNFVSRWMDPAKLRDSQVLNILDGIDKSSQIVHMDEHVQLMWLERAKLWILYGFLVCSSELQRPGALLLLRLALADTWFAPIFRDQVNFDHIAPFLLITLSLVHSVLCLFGSVL